MPQQDEFPAQLRQSHDSNRTEFLKHISIVSVAGLGFNLVYSKPDEFAWDLPSLLWWVSSGGFLFAIFCIIWMFRLASAHAETLYRAYNSGDNNGEKNLYLAIAKSREENLKWAGGVLPFIFTGAVISAIVLVLI